MNSGGSAEGTFEADRYFSGGNTYSSGAAITTTGVANAAATGVYQTERWGDFSYTLTGLTPSKAYIARLHFAEIWWTSAGNRVFNVAINGAQVLTNFDIVAAGGANTAVVRDFPVTANASGQVVIQYTTVKDNAKSSGVELLDSTAPPPANAAPTVATAAAANPNPVTASASVLSVRGNDDGGEANLIYTWDTTGSPPAPVAFSVNGTNGAKNTTATFTASGTYALRATLRDAGGLTATSTVSVTVNATTEPPPPPPPAGDGTPVYRINCGGPAVSPFAADQYVSGGNTYVGSNVVSTTGVTNAAPAAVYQTERYGNQTYTFPALTPNTAYTVRLHFAEVYWTAANQRKFNVTINGTSALSNFDIFAAAGANKPLVRDFTASANASGQIVVNYTTVQDNAKSSGIEIITTGGTTPPPPTNGAPTVQTAAAASPSSVTGTTTSLSVRGADDGGETSLTYTWATSGSPPAAVTFSSNGTNAAKTSTATFTRAGSYSFVATIRDAGGLTATSSVNVTVNQALTSVVVSPASTSVATGATQAFAASGRDQFGATMTAASTWAVSGGGTIASSGVFTAGGTAGGPFTVTATSGSRTGTATVSVTGGTTPPPTGGTLLLRADPTKRFLVNGSGAPFLVFGEGAWTLNSQLRVVDQNAYMDSRSARGMNAFGLQLISRYQDNSPNDADNVAPFTTPGDLATFNPTYFQKAADLVSRAAARGMVVFIAPIWAGYDSSQGFYDMMVQNGTTKVRNYGAAVANVFKDLDNVIWVMGGDKPAPVGPTDVFDALTAGIRSVDSRHLVTSHWNFAPGDVPNGNWTDIVSCYDWSGGVQYPQVRGEYDENDAPVVLLEALYELNVQFGATTKILRSQTIQALLFGAKGTFFGHEGVWALGASRNLPSQSQGKPYDLNSVGIRHQQQINTFFSTRDWSALVPDLSSTLVTGGRGSYGGYDYIGAAKTPNARLGVLYVPNGSRPTVNLAQLTTPLTARWFDPTNGAYTAVGTFTSGSSQTFTPPGNNSAGENDWILALESN